MLNSGVLQSFEVYKVIKYTEIMYFNQSLTFLV